MRDAGVASVYSHPRNTARDTRPETPPGHAGYPPARPFDFVAPGLHPVLLQSAETASSFRPDLRVPMQHPRKLFVFVALSLGDLLLTWQLLKQDATWLYEANPLGGWLLRRYGWAAVVALKLGTASAVSLLAVAISRV